MTEQQCILSGEMFEVSGFEMELREKFGFLDPPKISPKMRFRHLGAFWQHWNLHKRKCDKTGKDIISVFSEDCPYPVWHKDEWIKNADPPGEDFNEHEAVFPQMWNVFQNSPIPHNFQSHNENCEYTDDFYYSKDCYLCHSGQNQEKTKYCYGCDSITDVFWGVRSFESELCADLINSRKCFESFYLLNCKNVMNSAFLHDCRNCQECLFCFNLRNKKYCIGNQQLTEDEYAKKRFEYMLHTRTGYDNAKSIFAEMMRTQAWHRAIEIDRSENSTGNFLEYTKNCENCYLLTKHEDCCNILFSGPNGKSLLDSLGTVGGEFCMQTVLPVYCYGVEFCFSTNHSRFCEYSSFLKNCEYCFGCCGLVGKKYYIFNKPYSKDKYEELKTEIISKMKETGEYGWFFPGYFAANSYDESLSGYYWSLSHQEQKENGFRVNENTKNNDALSYTSTKEVPSTISECNSDTENLHFWDEKYQRPFQIQKSDMVFCDKLNIPPPNSFYMHRIQENFKWMFFTGSLRKTRCAKSGKEIETNYPKEFDERILCEEEYLKILK